MEEQAQDIKGVIQDAIHEVQAYLADTDIPLEERWDVYSDIEEYLPVSRFITHDPVLDELYGRSWLEDNEKKGIFRWSCAVEWDELCPKWNDDEKVFVYNDHWRRFAESVLQRGTGGFQWDW